MSKKTLSKMTGITLLVFSGEIVGMHIGQYASPFFWSGILLASLGGFILP